MPHEWRSHSEHSAIGLQKLNVAEFLVEDLHHDLGSAGRQFFPGRRLIVNRSRATDGGPARSPQEAAKQKEHSTPRTSRHP